MVYNGVKRVPVQQAFASRVCDIILPLDPNGVSMRFINDKTVYNGLKTSAEVSAIIGRVPYTGWTKIGTNMEQKILEPLVFKKIRENNLKKPVLIIVITDGWVRALILSFYFLLVHWLIERMGQPYEETDDHFRNVIRKGKKDLTDLRKPSTCKCFTSEFLRAPMTMIS